MKLDENKGLVILIMLFGVAVGAWSAEVLLATLVASAGVIIYSGIKHEEWLEHLFEP